ncbi:formyltransferase family protein [Haloarcula amylovorans]|uniref:formyltransferase family protein n=1 Tax=Haloarcula amylovorans TaxID=2562280 RepID=UPI001075D9DD|nr:formyltransferase family protein [Halomicroarcula amylolytica]
MPSVAFMGSHPLGERCLELLTDDDAFDVKLVVTYGPDEDTWWDGCLYDTAEELGHTAVTREDERDVLDLDIDYLLSVYYPNILGEELLDHPNVAPLNLHQAELPRYRGSNVFSHAILNAREDDHWKYGTTFHVMAPEVDAGDIVARAFVPIRETDTARTLYDRVTEKSVEMFREQLPTMREQRAHELATPQSAFDGERYFYTKQSLDGEKEISPERLAATDEVTQLEVYDKIRALDFPPFQPAYTKLGGHRVQLTATSYEDLFDDAPVPDFEVDAPEESTPLAQD